MAPPSLPSPICKSEGMSPISSWSPAPCSQVPLGPGCSSLSVSSDLALTSSCCLCSSAMPLCHCRYILGSVTYNNSTSFTISSWFQELRQPSLLEMRKLGRVPSDLSGLLGLTSLKTARAHLCSFQVSSVSIDGVGNWRRLPGRQNCSG